MNRDKLERWILLRQSGELGRWRARRLERALAKDPALRAFEADVQKLTAATRAWTTRSELSQSVHRIHEELLRTADRRDLVSLAPAPRRMWWPALAVPTALAALWLVVGWPSERTAPVVSGGVAGASNASTLAWEGGVDEELDALFELVYETGADISVSAASNTSDEDQLILELLELEGITI